MSAAQEVGPLYTARFVDLTTGEVSISPPTADTDQDGIPDNPFVTLTSDNTLWLAEVGVESTGGTRTLAALRWDGSTSLATDALSIDLDIKGPKDAPQRVLLEVPRQLLEPGEIGVVLLSIAPDPVTLFGAEEADLLAPEPEGVLVPGGQYVEISIMVSDDNGATFDELDEERVGRHPIRLGLIRLISETRATGTCVYLWRGSSKHRYNATMGPWRAVAGTAGLAGSTGLAGTTGLV